MNRELFAIKNTKYDANRNEVYILIYQVWSERRQSLLSVLIGDFSRTLLECKTFFYTCCDATRDRLEIVDTSSTYIVAISYISSGR